jgi:hypothetical protein
MLGIYAIPAPETVDAVFSSNIQYSDDLTGTINVYANGHVVGTNTKFIVWGVKANDLITFDTSESATRQYTKTITSVISNTVLTLESNTQYVYNGSATVANSSNTITLSGDDVSGNLVVGDNVALLIGNTVESLYITSLNPPNQFNVNAAIITGGSNLAIAFTPYYQNASFTILAGIAT